MPAPLPKEVRQQFNKMYRQGYAYKVIARALGIGFRTVARWGGPQGLGERRPGRPRKSGQ